MADRRIDVLGPLRVRVDGAEQRIGGRRERVVLAVLVAAAGREVPVQRLIDDVWGEQEPPSAVGSLQVAISRLRTTLQPDRAAGADSSALHLGRAGYALTGVLVDADQFSRHADQLAHAPPEEVLRRTEEALALWRGEPYADVPDVPSLVAEATRLREDRLRLVEARAQALLDLGRHDAAQAMLSPLVEEHLFRERLWSLLALALYRCARQADALETLRRLRGNLVEELGVDPSPSIQTLEEDVLAQAPHLDAPVERSSTRPTGAADATRSRTSGVVGRSQPLGMIDGAVSRLVEDGSGTTILLTGEPGIGKSTLAAELGRRAAARGALVLVGRSHEADLAPAFWPWLPVIRSLADESAPPEVGRLLGSGADVLEVVSAGAAALRTYDAVSRVLGSVARPLVVVLEDLHWSDTSSLRLLMYAAEALRGSPVLLVATTRDLSPHANPALTEALAGLARLGAMRVRIPSLGREAVGELVREVLPAAGHDLVEVLADRTDGNPFFALEMARLLAASGRVSVRDAVALDVPDGVADVLRMRLRELSESAREVLSATSVIGRDFDAGVVREAADAGESDVLELLDEAVAAGLVQSHDQLGRYRFVHALTRETVYGDLPPGRRALWHARVGQALTSRLAEAPELIAEVAHHLSRAAAYLPELVVPAVRYGAEAAEAAEHRGAFDEAVALWNRTSEIERRASDRDPTRRHRLLVRLATARQRIGDMAGMQAALNEAIELARHDGDYERMAEAATSFRSSGVWHWRELGRFDAETVEVLLTCRQHIHDPGRLARIWANLGLEYYVAWRPDDADACGERSLELARQSGDSTVLRDCLSARQVALWHPGRAADLEVCARESLELPLGLEDSIAARFHLAMALHRQGRGPEAEEVMGEGLRLAQEQRHTGCDVPLAWRRWMRAVETLAPEAHELAAAALALHRRSTVVGLTEMTGLVALVGAPDGADVPQDVLAAAAGHPNRSYRAVVARAVAKAGDPAGAMRLLGELAPPDESDYASLFATCMWVDALADLPAHDALTEAVDRLLPYVDEVATYGSVASAGSTAYFAGRGLIALSDVDGGRRLIEQALAANAAAHCLRWEHQARAALDALEGRGLRGKRSGTGR